MAHRVTLKQLPAVIRKRAEQEGDALSMIFESPTGKYIFCYKGSGSKKTFIPVEGSSTQFTVVEENEEDNLPL